MNTLPPELQALSAERGQVYGDPRFSHTNIGLSWTGLLQQHYGIEFPHPLPAGLVAMMMSTFKVQRSARVYKQDNYDDAHVYLSFAADFQRQSFPSPITTVALVGECVTIPVAEYQKLQDAVKRVEQLERMLMLA